MHNVIYSRMAEQDIYKIYDVVYNLSCDLSVAENYINGIKRKISEQKKHPKTGSRFIYKGLFTGFYYVKYKAYLIFYRIQDDRIIIIRILPEKSDYEDRLL